MLLFFLLRFFIGYESHVFAFNFDYEVLVLVIRLNMFDHLDLGLLRGEDFLVCFTDIANEMPNFILA